MNNSLKILFTGDFCPQLRVQDLIEKEQYDLIFNDFKRHIDESDWTIVDLECPLTERNTPINKTGPHLKASPQAIRALQYASVNAVAMANNHIKDYGDEALLETRQICEEAGIKTIGVGVNLEEARKPLWIENHGLRVAVLNITENEWSNTQGMDVGANPLDLLKNFQDIQAAKLESDFVIIVYHGGNEFYELPSPRLKETFRFFVDTGASAVISHHTHIVSGYEVYKKAPLFYSLGNFCFDWPDQRNSFWNIGLAVRLTLNKIGDIGFELLPFKQNDADAGIHELSVQEREVFDDNIKKRSAIIENDHLLEKKFEQYCQEKQIIYNIYMEPYRNNVLAALYKRGLIPSFLSRQKKRLLLNIMRCESHRDVLLEILKRA